MIRPRLLLFALVVTLLYVVKTSPDPEDKP